MNALLRGNAALLVARLVVGGLFVKQGLSKVDDPVAFLKLIREYELVPEGLPWLLNGMAVGLPWLEVLAGALLVLGIAVRGTCLTLLALLAVFTSAIALRAVGIQESEGLAFCEIAFDCGCGSGAVNVCNKLAENTGLFVLALVGLLTPATGLCLRARVFGGSAADG